MFIKQSMCFTQQQLKQRRFDIIVIVIIRGMKNEIKKFQHIHMSMYSCSFCNLDSNYTKG